MGRTNGFSRLASSQLIQTLCAVMSKKTYIIDGEAFSTLAEFAQHFSAVLLEDYQWHGNLDALNDILRGGFGTPDEGFVLVWRNSELSRRRLSYSETVKWLKACRKSCHPSNVENVDRELYAARKSEGTTLFDWLVEIICDHGPGGSNDEDGVELRLE